MAVELFDSMTYTQAQYETIPESEVTLHSGTLNIVQRIGGYSAFANLQNAVIDRDARQAQRKAANVNRTKRNIQRIKVNGIKPKKTGIDDCFEGSDEIKYLRKEIAELKNELNTVVVDERKQLLKKFKKAKYEVDFQNAKLRRMRDALKGEQATSRAFEQSQVTEEHRNAAR